MAQDYMGHNSIPLLGRSPRRALDLKTEIELTGLETYAGIEQGYSENGAKKSGNKGKMA